MAAAKTKPRIKKDDIVIVISGKDRKTVGRVVRVIPDEHQVVVEGVRKVRRHRKPVGDTPGGIIEKEMPLDISNVALWNATEERRIKVAYREIDGRKVRVDRRTGTVLDKE